MLDTIAMWGGVAGCALALVAVFAIIIVKAKISSILNRDNILFDQNFELKKEAIEEALNLVDELESDGSVAQSSNFVNQAKNCYNKLLCVCSKMSIAESFYSLTLENIEPATPIKIAKFKLACRKDIGLSSKGSKLVLRATARAKSGYSPEQNSFANPSFNQPVQPQPVRPAQPVQPAQPVRPAQPMQRPVQPQPARPAQPVQRPMPRPTQPGQPQK